MQPSLPAPDHPQDAPTPDPAPHAAPSPTPTDATRSSAEAPARKRRRALAGAAVDEQHELLVSLSLISEGTWEHIRTLHFPGMSTKKVQRALGPLFKATPPLIEERLRYRHQDKGAPPVPLEPALRLTEAGCGAPAKLALTQVR